MLETALEIWKSYEALLKTQPVIAGMVSLYAVGVATYFFKSLPLRFYNYIKSQFLVSVTIQNHDNLFIVVSDWLEKEAKVFRCKNFISNIKSRTENGLTHFEPSMKVGLGAHIFFHNNWIYFLTRNEKDLQNSREVKENISITTFGIGHSRLTNMLKDALPKPAPKTKTFIYEKGGSYWSETNRVEKRNLDSVALKDETRDALKAHVSQFLQSKEWYKKYEIPYRTGIILEGPPGTGKTTTSLAICGEFDCDLYIVNLGAQTDKGLAETFRSIPDKAVVLIEDIDSYRVATSRDPVAVKKEDKKDSIPQDSGELTIKSEMADLWESGSLSGLLNAIDGVSSSEDRILIATTNHLEKLDKALIRPGRFELILKIDNMCNEVCHKMFAKFYPTFELPHDFAVREGISPAEFQCMAIANKENPQALLDFCQQKCETITSEVAV